MNYPDWQDEPFQYALVALPKHKIIHVDDVMDVSVVIMTGSYNQCDAEETRLIALSYEKQVERFEAAYEDHLEEMWEAGYC